MSKKNNETINSKEFDPALMLECANDVSDLVKGHVMVLEGVKHIIEKATKFGLNDQQAATIAVTLHKRAAEKASSMVHMDDDEMVAEKEEHENDHTESDK